MKVNPAGAGLDEGRLERITEHLQHRYIDAGRIAGCQVAVARHGQVGYFRSLGSRDLGRSEPVEEDTIWRIISLHVSCRDDRVTNCDLPENRLTGPGGRAWRRVQQRGDPSARADAECRACGDQFVVYSLRATFAHPNADTGGGLGSTPARPGYEASDEIACATASGGLVLSA